eukprot:12054544-Alexandrium_andersonii.AAC.1
MQMSFPNCLKSADPRALRVESGAGLSGTRLALAWYRSSFGGRRSSSRSRCTSAFLGALRGLSLRLGPTLRSWLGGDLSEL